MMWYTITVKDAHGVRGYGTDVEADARREYRKIAAVKVTSGPRSVTLTEDSARTMLVVFDYSDRKNGWYAQRLDAEGNQIGDAEYRYTKDEIQQVATDLALAHNCKMRRA